MWSKSGRRTTFSPNHAFVLVDHDRDLVLDLYLERECALEYEYGRA